MTDPEAIKLATQIKLAYLAHVKSANAYPTDAHAMCDDHGIEIGAFYEIYEDLKEVHSAIWTDLAKHTLQALAEDDQFEQFGAREQLLAFYYTHIEIIKPYRALLQLDRARMRVPIPIPRFMIGYKEAFVNFAQNLIEFGLLNKEIADRKFLNKQYPQVLWSQLYWLIQFWLKDESLEYEKTDAAIEKAVDLSFELSRPGPIDSMIDFAKFIYQNR